MNKKILIVDDDFSLRTVMIKALSSKSIDVRSVSSVSEAWVLISNESFDLIICDVLLPDGDGLELVKKIKDKNVNQKIIIISAQNNIITAIKADELNTIVLESIKELDCSSIKDLGKLISFLKSKYPGQLDMQEVAEKAKKNLQ